MLLLLYYYYYYSCCDIIIVSVIVMIILITWGRYAYIILHINTYFILYRRTLYLSFFVACARAGVGDDTHMLYTFYIILINIILSFCGWCSGHDAIPAVYGDDAGILFQMLYLCIMRSTGHFVSGALLLTLIVLSHVLWQVRIAIPVVYGDDLHAYTMIRIIACRVLIPFISSLVLGQVRNAIPVVYGALVYGEEVAPQSVVGYVLRCSYIYIYIYIYIYNQLIRRWATSSGACTQTNMSCMWMRKPCRGQPNVCTNTTRVRTRLVSRGQTGCARAADAPPADPRAPRYIYIYI